MLGDPARDGEAEAGALAGARGIRSVEAFEDPLAVLELDSRPVVPDDESRPTGVDLETSRDRRARVLERVVEQDPQELAQRVLVSHDAGVDHLDLERALRMDGGGLPGHVDDDRAEVYWRELEAKPGVGTRQREHAIDEPTHAHAFLGDVGGGRKSHRLGDRRTMREQPRVALD